jgi:predicted O-methyltransferase YrrM
MPLRLSSGAAADVLRCFGLTADFVFIDADHEYRAVLDDMHLYYQLLTPGGVLFGDDLTWPGVARAVPEFLHIYGLKRNYNANLSDATWVIEKPTNDNRLPLFNMHV